MLRVQTIGAHASMWDFPNIRVERNASRRPGNGHVDDAIEAARDRRCLVNPPWVVAFLGKVRLLEAARLALMEHRD